MMPCERFVYEYMPYTDYRTVPPSPGQRPVRYRDVHEADCNGYCNPIERPWPLGEKWPGVTSSFRPCVVSYPEAGVTEIVTEDRITIWTPWGNEGVELGYSESGELVAVRLPIVLKKANAT